MQGLVVVVTVLCCLASASSACNTTLLQDCGIPVSGSSCAVAITFRDCASTADCNHEPSVTLILESFQHCWQDAIEPAIYTVDGTLQLSGSSVVFETNNVSLSLDELYESVNRVDSQAQAAARTTQDLLLGTAVNLTQAINTATESLDQKLHSAIDDVSSAVFDQASSFQEGLASSITSLESKFEQVYNKTQVDIDSATNNLMNTVQDTLASMTACQVQGMFYNTETEECERTAPSFTTAEFECDSDNEGRVLYDAGVQQLFLCDGVDFVPVASGSTECDPESRGLSPDCPAHSCAFIADNLPSASSGIFYVGVVPPAKAVYCDIPNRISRGGNGTSELDPGTDCLTLKSLFHMPSGAYWLDTPTGVRQAYCDMELDGGGWQLVWLHAYLQNGAVDESFAFFAGTDTPCTSLSANACNTPRKTAQGAVEQMTVAYNSGVPKYAYKSHLNHLLDTSYRGGILLDPVQVLDACTQSKGVPPEPVDASQQTEAVAGVTFDKHNPLKYTGNCDTDRYLGGSKDCRWENCIPDGSYHKQMTVVIYIRTSEEVAVRRAIEEQGSPLDSCKDVLDFESPESGIYALNIDGKPTHVWCEVGTAADTTFAISLGGDGSTSSAASRDCTVLKEKFAKNTGTYFLQTPNGVRRGYCDMTTDGGAWHLQWKHLYLEVDPISSSMTFFSQYDKPCVDLGDGWCNEANKGNSFASQQMTVAYHYERIVYAYRGDMNRHHDTDWTAAVLNNPVQVIDTCSQGSGIAPEPVGPYADNMYAGLTFDKWNAGVYTGNCDTDQYRYSSRDCRWENCKPPSGEHNKMMVAILFRATLQDVINGVVAEQDTSVYSSCKAIKAATGTTVSGTYAVVRDGKQRNVYCEMAVGGGGWELVWKHAYYQVPSVGPQHAFFTSNDQPCVDLADGWCNEPNKLSRGANEQMTAGFHHGILVFAYKGAINTNLDTDWTGAILNSPVALHDDCGSSKGVRPEPVHPSQSGIYAGITFDKWNPGTYTGNCDTDRYGSGGDCRWENCGPSFGNHKQQTYSIFIR
eukprot:m.360847 g.360847  ORF g.360847 m.360847 type:complete len:1032 (+) comp19206_c0_seq1:101-3196(+)